MTWLEALSYCEASGNADVAWIAQHFASRKGPYRAINVKSVAILTKVGYLVSDVPYRLPHEAVCINGTDVTPQEMRELAGY